MFLRKTPIITTAESALPGHPQGHEISGVHFVDGSPMVPPFGEEIEIVYLAMGCFWGAERIFWELPGVYTTAVGYTGGFTENASYEEVCSGRTGHAEAVMVAYDPEVIPLDRVLKRFWEEHDPTQGNRQGNDVGSQYRSAIYWVTGSQRDDALRSREVYGTALHDGGFGEITTEITEAGEFYFAEEYHQQYLAKNLGGYCNHGFCQIEYTSALAANG